MIDAYTAPLRAAPDAAFVRGLVGFIAALVATVVLAAAAAS